MHRRDNLNISHSVESEAGRNTLRHQCQSDIAGAISVFLANEIEIPQDIFVPCFHAFDALRQFALVDPVSVADDKATPRLPVDLSETHRR